MRVGYKVCYEVIPTDRFDNDVRFYYKKRKYRKIESDLEPILAKLEDGNFLGDEISGLELPDDKHSYKVRVANTSANVGKSNGFRLIYYVVKDDKEIFLLTLYSKKDKENISTEEIERLIKLYCT
jgi:mRNA-degrading endonuclease RelE of RelBE toxin-antitoxin system